MSNASTQILKEDIQAFKDEGANPIRLAREGSLQEDVKDYDDMERIIPFAYSNKPQRDLTPIVEIIKGQWSGVVIRHDKENLTARLQDLIDDGNPEEEVTLSIEEIDEQERALIRDGAMFSWYIGYRKGYKYPQERFSKIRFRRLPVWSEREISDAENLALEYGRFFSNDTDNTSST